MNLTTKLLVAFAIIAIIIVIAMVAKYFLDSSNDWELHKDMSLFGQGSKSTSLGTFKTVDECMAAAKKSGAAYFTLLPSGECLTSAAENAVLVTADVPGAISGTPKSSGKTLDSGEFGIK